MEEKPKDEDTPVIKAKVKGQTYKQKMQEKSYRWKDHEKIMEALDSLYSELY